MASSAYTNFTYLRLACGLAEWLPAVCSRHRSVRIHFRTGCRPEGFGRNTSEGEPLTLRILLSKRQRAVSTLNFEDTITLRHCSKKDSRC